MYIPRTIRGTIYNFQWAEIFSAKQPTRCSQSFKTFLAVQILVVDSCHPSGNQMITKGHVFPQIIFETDSSSFSYAKFSHERATIESLHILAISIPSFQPILFSSLFVPFSPFGKITDSLHAINRYKEIYDSYGNNMIIIGIKYIGNGLEYW